MNLMKIIIPVLVTITLFSCTSSNNFHKDKALFESSPVLRSFRSVADMNDSYFVIKDNNFFEFYRVLFDSVKNTRYPGRYHKNGDTLVLQFYNRKGYELLGNKMLVDENSNQVTFFK